MGLLNDLSVLPLKNDNSTESLDTIVFSQSSRTDAMLTLDSSDSMYV